MNCSIRGGVGKRVENWVGKAASPIECACFSCGLRFSLAGKDRRGKNERGEKEKRPEGKTIQSESTQEKAQQQYIWGKLHPVSHKSGQKANLQIIRI